MHLCMRCLNCSPRILIFEEQWMMSSVHKCFVGIILLLFILGFHSINADATRSNFDDIIQSPTLRNLPTFSKDDNIGTRWAILVAGSAGYSNYRHQADVCHAYQILRKGGLQKENIVVFMYDDIAYNPGNPHAGVIINNPHGGDVYEGVPKDYTGENVSVDNFFAVLLGEKGSVQGGSGKVVDSGPNDHIFIYYSDHGGPGVLGMPNRPNLYADDFIEVLKKKNAAGTYKQMVIYVEACESGSIFEGLLPEGMNIYVTTASNAEESSWGTYCPGMSTPPPSEYDVCLGDLYSVAWMEDSEVHNLKEETLEQQYLLVKDRTSNHNTYAMGSHVMQYGDVPISKEPLYLYIGFDPANANVTTPSENDFPQILEENYSKAINQRDADLLYLWQKYRRSKDDSPEKLDTRKEIVELMTHRIHIDRSIKIIGELLFGSEMGPAVLKAVRLRGQPLVDDWGCLKTLVRIFESHCGSLSQYGLKHMRAIANICNKGVTVDTMDAVSAEACPQIPSGLWSSLQKGYSA